MRVLIKFLGLALVIAGIYFLGKNIFFTTQTSYFWWQNLPATGSVVALIAGSFTLLFGSRSSRDMGWILVGLGIVLVFLSGGVMLRPTSLWNFFLAFMSLVGGYKLLTTGRIDF